MATKRPDLAARNKASARHGMTGTRTHRVWVAMMSRCHVKSAKAYAMYGAKGIKVCEAWKTFENFYADMGECPDDMTIDRIDNCKGYEPSNCRWATWRDQANNRSNNVMVSCNGITQSIADWARTTGLERKTLEYRIRAGWEASKALQTQPLIRRKNHGI
jgi:hypothetical protein